ncbi:PLP-dependent aminotransferase family protein [Paenarthrobacter sp. PH39-S1]|uniref:MocR-like pyridoxine biosynthesis transcription factor PdxR n=1 Tax=Micrococcaceae TaxID=1268 RepID=UPI0024B88E3E|nr:PLP-dependent aminotransferase family protein [Paenarthrobacter sp. PH39-S1]MDJ0357979.1 PLP-dependent aminotransferase family protein [Paenarthrobacter sp. PH39-S1]
MARTRQQTPNDLALIQAPPGTPLHLRVRRTVEGFIASGVWPTGTRIPSSRQIAELLGVSRTTVQAAYSGLLDDGFIVAKSRSGFFVNHQISPISVDHGSSPGVHASHAEIDWVQLASSAAPALPELDREPRWWTFEYPFVTGQHDPAHFPAAAWIRALKASLATDEHRHASLDDVLMDDPLLLETICQLILPARGIFTEPDNVLITLGSQQGLQLLGESLLHHGDSVLVESPGYLDARHVFSRAGANLGYLPVDAEGAIPQESYSHAKLIYLTPSHQHPTNVTLTAKRRLDIIGDASRHNFIIVEDDYDSELRYEGQPSPAMAALDPNGRTIYLGTMSKVLAPGIRIGFLVGPSPLIAILRKARRYQHRQPPGQIQRAVALLYQSGDFRTSMQSYRRALGTRWHTASAIAREIFPDEQTLPPGGTGLWLKAPAQVDTRELRVLAKRNGILFDSGEKYFATRHASNNYMRIGFASIPNERIEPGLLKLAALFDQDPT